MNSESANGGYDEGYKSCPCFWGRDPGSLIKKLERMVDCWQGLRVLDVGCGEGKNAHFLGKLGAQVVALDHSQAALKNATGAWPFQKNVNWVFADIRTYNLQTQSVDIVVLYGLLHCLKNQEELVDVVRKLQNATVLGGFHVLCSFNARKQDLRNAHPGFKPLLISHSEFLKIYLGWEIIEQSDSDLSEVHPHNGVPHVHSMTRFIAKKV